MLPLAAALAAGPLRFECRHHRFVHLQHRRRQQLLPPPLPPPPLPSDLVSVAVLSPADTPSVAAALLWHRRRCGYLPCYGRRSSPSSLSDVTPAVDAVVVTILSIVSGTVAVCLVIGLGVES